MTDDFKITIEDINDGKLNRMLNDFAVSVINGKNHIVAVEEARKLVEKIIYDTKQDNDYLKVKDKIEYHPTTHPKHKPAAEQAFKPLIDLIAKKVNDAVGTDNTKRKALNHALDVDKPTIISGVGVISTTNNEEIAAKIYEKHKEEFGHTKEFLGEVFDEPSDNVLAVISNIHGNARALWPVLSYLSNNGINEIYCLGDILGYGPFPNECWEKIVKRTQFVVGDFELAMLDEEYTKGKNWTDTALKSLAWQREIFKYKSELESYRSKIKLRVGNIIFTHADLTRPYEFIDLENRGRRDKLIEENLEEMKRQNIKICFVGHTGKPFFAGRKSDNTLFIDDHIKNQSYEIKDYVQVLINVGSIGFPQDGNKESCFVVCNRLENKVFFIRNDYLNKDVFKDFAKVIKDNKFDEKTARSILDTLNTGI